MKSSALLVLLFSLSALKAVASQLLPTTTSLPECNERCSNRDRLPFPPTSTLQDEIMKGRCNLGCKSATEVNECVESCELFGTIINNPNTTQTSRSPANPVTPPVVSIEGSNVVIRVENFTDNVFVIRIRDEERNYTAYRATNTSIYVHGASAFICLNLSISYATVNLIGESNFSLETQIEVYPDAPQNIVTSLVEDLDFYQHAIVTISWDRPHLFDSLCGYELTVSLINERNKRYCHGQEDYVVTLGKEVSSHVIQANNNSNSTLPVLPLYVCNYKLTLRSLPGQNANTDIIEVKYNGRDREPMIVTCAATFDHPSNSYNISATWILNPLAEEAIESYSTQFYQLEGNLRSRPRSFGELVTERNITYTNVSALTPSQGSYQIEVRVVGAPGSSRDPQFRYFYRKPIIPFSIKLFRCNPVRAPPMQPSVLADIKTENLTYIVDDNLIELILSWDVPIFPNGQLEEYELYVGLEILEGSDPVAPNSTIRRSSVFRRVDASRASVTLQVHLIQFDIEGDNSAVLYLQMRSRNVFDLLSNWSAPIVLDKAQATVVDAPELSQSTPFESESTVLPSYAYAVFAAAAVILIAVIITPFIVYFVCRIHRRQNGRNQKYDISRGTSATNEYVLN